jgi:hypothetical protein
MGQKYELLLYSRAFKDITVQSVSQEGVSRNRLCRTYCKSKVKYNCDLLSSKVKIDIFFNRHGSLFFPSPLSKLVILSCNNPSFAALLPHVSSPQRGLTLEGRGGDGKHPQMSD